MKKIEKARYNNALFYGYTNKCLHLKKNGSWGMFLSQFILVVVDFADLLFHYLFTPVKAWDQ